MYIVLTWYDFVYFKTVPLNFNLYMIYTCINKHFFSFCFFHTVFLQQAPSNIKYPHHSRGIHDILPALLINVFREVAPDHIISPHPVQQLLRFLQTVT